MVRCVVDNTIPYALAALHTLGEATALAPADITRGALADAEVLWVSSAVRVDAKLLAGTKVRFIASLTSDTAHLDTAWLKEQGIHWTYAPEIHARGVALWWTLALSTLAVRRGFKFEELRIGIVGVGHVGKLIEEIVSTLGAKVMRCDPPRARAEGPMRFFSLDEVCRIADVVTLHVPLRREGSDATHHLMDAHYLGGLSRDVVLVNSSHGDVLDAHTLLEMQPRKNLLTILDVYPDEPNIPRALVETAALATPHVAGYTADAQAAAAKLAYNATCAHLGLRVAPWTPARLLPKPPVRVMACETRELSDEAILLKVLRRFYRIDEDDAALRALVERPDAAEAWRRYRASYPARRELCETRIELRPPRPRVAKVLTVLGADVGWLDEPAKV